MLEHWPRPLLLGVPLLVVLGLLVWLPRRGVATRGVALFRCLLPSWRFFDQIESVPDLLYRAAPHGDDWSDWQKVLPVPARTAGSLWLNAAGNLHLACRSLVEHWVADLVDLPELAEEGVTRDAPELVSYRLLCALVEQRARATLPSSPRLRYQFRLLDTEQADTPLFLSRVHESE